MPRKPGFNQLLRFAYIYCRKQRQKRARNRNNDEGPSESSNQELKNEETVSITQELEYTEETITNTEGFTRNQELKLRQTFSSAKNQELKLTETEVYSNQDLDEKDIISSKQVLEDLKNVASNVDQQTEYRETISNNQEFENTEALTGNVVLEITEVLEATKYE